MSSSLRRAGHACVLAAVDFLYLRRLLWLAFHEILEVASGVPSS